MIDKFIEEYQTVSNFYKERGFGGRVGYGRKPAVIVIDMAEAWLNPKTSIIGSDLSDVLRNTKKVLAEARKKKIPVIFTTMAYDPQLAEAGDRMLKKLPHIKESLFRNTDTIVLHPELERRPEEILIEKQRASAFFGTTLVSYLIAHSIDTLIITGCSTSGCVRATAESSHNYNLHTIIVSEAVGDRSPLAHAANLVDIDNRYADVEEVDKVINYLKNLNP